VAIPAYIRVFLAISGYFWLLLAISGYFWLFLGPFVNGLGELWLMSVEQKRAKRVLVWSECVIDAKATSGYFGLF
jgi:hypothetical protein